MNAILLIADTLRRDHLGCYGNTWIHTPNLDGFAKLGMVFDRAYAASFPTVPNRTDVLTGRFTLTYRGWQPLGPSEVVIGDVLRNAGYTAMMVADTPHILQHGYGYQRGFSAFEWIRGQENDPWRTHPREVALPCSPSKLRNPHTTMVQYLRNIADRRVEADHFCARTMRTAAEWLEQNRDRPFFLYVDTFDPHEPWDPPRHYVDLYDPGYAGEEVTYPRYSPPDFLTADELKHVRALYAGEVSLVDTWVGYLLQTVERLGLFDDTYVFITTDHGFCHGEHNLLGKAYIVDESRFGYAPLWEEIAHIPLLVRGPGVKLGRCPCFTQSPDLMPTLLSLLGAEIPATVQGASFAHMLRGDNHSIRDFAISGPALTGRAAGGRLTFTMGEWSLIHRAVPGAEQTESAVDSIARTPMPYADEPSALYNLRRDPGQLENVLDRHRPVAEAMHRRMLGFLGSLGAPDEEIRARESL